MSEPADLQTIGRIQRAGKPEGRREVAASALGIRYWKIYLFDKVTELAKMDSDAPNGR
jgi:hypothetical protein